MRGLPERVRDFCALHRLFAPGVVVVAVSGGADSVALLHILLQLQDEFAIRLHVATLDHGLRGPDGAADVNFVRDLAAAWGVPVTAGAADVRRLANEAKLGIEAAARRARYAFLARVAAEQGAWRIATGHQRDDQAETVLMHVLRGAGLAGLRGMLPLTHWPAVDPDGDVSDRMLVRPLLDVTRAEIDDYVRGLGIRPRRDATNADPSYTRNRIRREIMPALARLNPDAPGALNRLAAHARDEYAALLATLPAPSPREGGLAFPLGVLPGLEHARARTAIRLAAQALAPGGEFSFERIEAARVFLAADRRGVIELGGGVRFEVGGDHALVYDPARYPPGAPWLPAGAQLAIDGPGEYALPRSNWRLQITVHAGDPPHDPLSARLAIPRGAQVMLRTPQPGDRMRPRGLRGRSRKLSDVLIDMRVRAAWRHRLPVLDIDGEAAWLVAPLADGPRGRVAEPFSGMGEGVEPLLLRFEPPETGRA
ncbi:MAG: tRNA lysidine(34) synthetase TilS [Anaerolineae bacterium]|nr:tRNA lysidine(34) synthetase TilS [Anaerolineae bacterium]